MKTKKLLTEQNSLNTNKPLIPTIADERLIPFLDRNGYSRDCAEVFTQYWHVACMAPIVGAVYMFITREKLWSMWDTFGRIPYAAYNKIKNLTPQRSGQIKKIFDSPKVQSLNRGLKKRLFFVLIISAITGVATYKTYDKITTDKEKDSIADTIGDLFALVVQYPVAYLGTHYRMLKNSDVGRASGLQSNDCAELIYALLAAAGAVTLLMRTKGLRPIAKIQDLIWDTLTKKLGQATSSVKSYVYERLGRHLDGTNIPTQARSWFQDLVADTKRYDDISMAEAKQMYRDLFGDDTAAEADEAIEIIWRDGVYQQEQALKELSEEALDLTRRSDDVLRQGADDLEQMGFNLDDTPLALPAPKVDDLPSIVSRSGEAFNSGNVRQGLNRLDDLADFYRESGLLRDAAVVQQIKQIINDVRSEVPNITDFEIMRILISKSKDILSDIPNPKEAKNIIAKVARQDLDVPDSEIIQIIEDQVDDLLFYSTANLPAHNSDAIPAMREEAIETTKGFWKRLMDDGIPKKHAAMLAIGAMGTILTVDAIYSKKEFKPSGSPYYFDDDSIYSILNGPTGANHYMRYREAVLNDPGAVAALSKAVFKDAKNKRAVQNYLIRLSKKKINVDDDPEKRAEEAVRGYAKVIKDVGVPGDIMDILSAATVYNISDVDETVINKRNAQYQMVIEMFLFNDVVFAQLKRYFSKMRSRSADDRLDVLKRIFSFDKAKRSSALTKLSQMDDFYARDNRKNRSKPAKIKEVKQMSKKDLRMFVQDFLNENTGQGYGKYPYHSNEYSDQEPDQDYNVEWSSFIDDVCGAKKKNVDGNPKTVEDMSVEVAKLLVKDSDLFRDVLETAGANKSIGVEIMSQFKASMEKKNLDKELNV